MSSVKIVPLFKEGQGDLPLHSLVQTTAGSHSKERGGPRFGGWNALIIPHLFLPLDLLLVWIRECRRLLVAGKEGDKKDHSFSEDS